MSLQTFKHRINRVALRAAAFSACFGIFLVLLVVITASRSLLPLGFYHLIPTVFIHLGLLLGVIINAILHREDMAEHVTTLFLMLLNIPLAIICSHIVFAIL